MSDIVERLRARKATWMEAIEAMEAGAAEIKRLRSENKSWKPIETAPKDGTLFLGVTKNGKMRVDYLDSSVSLHQFYRERGDDRYTHWMPLPEGPEGK